MMKSTITLLGAGALLLALAGCDGNKIGAPDPLVNSVAGLMAADPDGDPYEITDVEAFAADVEAVFGRDLPWPVEEQDTLSDVHARAAGS